MGEVEVELGIWLDDRERALTDQTPAKLQISMERLAPILTAKFDAAEWDGIGHFRVIFSIFDVFELLSYFSISNEKLFRLLYALRDAYNKVPYHNWRHAVDVTQFASFQLLSAGSPESGFSKSEILACLLAALCHDVNHDGFTTVANARAQTPLGILFKQQSVIEMHHCSIAIKIISKDETNVLSNLNSSHSARVWSLIISLILATDMGRHFVLVEEFAAKVRRKEFSIKEPADRIMLLSMLLKCADLAPVVRPFDLASKWAEFVSEEFFRQGDLEKAKGMQYTSTVADREHLDKPKSQMGFYTSVCLPLFGSVALVMPALDSSLRQLNANIAKWQDGDTKKTK
jgi:hypothetical protein